MAKEQDKSPAPYSDIKELELIQFHMIPADTSVKEGVAGRCEMWYQERKELQLSF